MGWVDLQIRQRIRGDNESFEQAFEGMADAVLGERLGKALNDSRIQTQNAIDEILKYYHIPSTPLPEDIKDLDSRLEYLMRPSGVMRRTVELLDDWYRDAMGAMLGVRKEDGVPVALLPRGGSGYELYNPQTGRKEKVTAAVARQLEVEAVCFYRSLPLKKIGVPELLRFMLGTLETWDLALIVSITLAGTLVGLLIPKITNIIYSRIIGQPGLRLLFSTFSFLLCVKLSQALLQAMQTLMMERISGKMEMAVQAAGMMRLLSMPAGFFRGYAAGELANRIESLNNVCTMLMNALLQTGLTTVFSLSYLSQMFRYGPALVAPGMLVILCTVLFSLLAVFIKLHHSRAIMEAEAKENGMAYSLITGVQKIRLSGAEKRAFSKWADSYAVYARTQYNIPMLLKLADVASACIALTGTVVIYFFTIQNGISLPDYYAFSAAFGMVMGAFTALINEANSVAQVKPMLDMVKPFLNTLPEISQSQKVVTNLRGGIEINNVSFRYQDSGPLIIDDLSLKIKPGQYIAVVGSTGCGKSTLLRLLLGFEKPQKGAIYYDGIDMASLDLKSLRRKMGVVIQNGKLLQGDLFSNITLTAPWLTLKEAWEAAETAGIAEDIRNMPMGMHTLVSEGGGGLSGGQRQRLLIAAAVAPKPKILMFDEATSALDNLTQKAVSEALDGLKCTRIVIAHRLSTIRQCDRIVVLDGGKIIEDGNYAQLLEKNGFFAQLVARQRLDTDSKQKSENE